MKPANARKIADALALLIALAAFGLTAAASRSPFERLPHLEDEVAYLFQARVFAGGQVVIDSPEPHRAYWQPFVVDYAGRRFGKYPPGWPLLLAVGVLLGQPWVSNAFLAALSVALIYRLGRAIFDAETGLVAAVLTASSPMFLLLSGSLMGHTAALFWGVLFVFALWKVERTGRAVWAAAAGAALGMLFNTRPLTAVGMALPFALGLAGMVLWRGIKTWWRRGWRPLLAFGAAAALTATMTPLFNAAATGSPTTNLYTLVWPYDQVGFGECCGRSGHTPEKGIRNTKADLALWSSDLFGWQMDADLHRSLEENAGWWLGRGVSWVLLPVGLIARRRSRWTWALLGTFAGLVGAHVFYWVGAQTYSARYYYEALPGLALISAAGFTGLARRVPRGPAYAVLAVMIAASLLGYTPARLGVLWRFNDIGQDDIAALRVLRDGRPVLILVTGEQPRSWREWGTYMALTSPYLDSDVVAARDRGWQGEREAILARLPGRQVLYLPPDNHLTWRE